MRIYAVALDAPLSAGPTPKRKRESASCKVVLLKTCILQPDSTPKHHFIPTPHLYHGLGFRVQGLGFRVSPSRSLIVELSPDSLINSRRGVSHPQTPEKDPKSRSLSRGFLEK